MMRAAVHYSSEGSYFQTQRQRIGITEGGNGKSVVNLSKMHYEARDLTSLKLNSFHKDDDNKTKTYEKS